MCDKHLSDAYRLARLAQGPLPQEKTMAGPADPPPELSPASAPRYPPTMIHPIFRRLRRCRTFLVLALCAWLALSSVAWAMPRHDECCPAPSAMAMGHGLPDHDAAHAPDSCCAHAPASVPDAVVPHVLHVHASGSLVQADRADTPQPFYQPPLRPPLG